jgi:hypothetical protein
VPVRSAAADSDEGSPVFDMDGPPEERTDGTAWGVASRWSFLRLDHLCWPLPNNLLKNGDILHHLPPTGCYRIRVRKQHLPVPRHPNTPRI